MKRFAPIFAALLILALPAVCRAQASTAPPAPAPIFTCSTGAIAVRLAGQTVPATDLSCAFAVTKNNIVESQNLLAPGLDLQGYYGTYRRNIDLAWLTKKTNIPSGMFQPYIEASGGVVRNVPASGAVVQNLSAMVVGGFDYDPAGTSKFTVGPKVLYFYAPGFGGSPHGLIFSANLAVILGSK